jgi:hypothetical protein
MDRVFLAFFKLLKPEVLIQGCINIMLTVEVFLGFLDTVFFAAIFFSVKTSLDSFASIFFAIVHKFPPLFKKTEP